MFIKKQKKEMKNCEQEWRCLPIKEKIAIITAVAAFIAGWALSIAGFIVPPLGEVAESTLWILGQALVYAASVFGITGYFTSETRRLRHDIDLKIGDYERMRNKEEIEDETE